MKIEPTKGFVKKYVMMMLAQFAAIETMIELHKEHDPDEVGDPNMTIAYVVNATIDNAGEEEERARRGDSRKNTIILSPKSEDYDVILTPQVKINTNNIPPTALMYHVWSGICASVGPDILSSLILVPSKKKEGQYVAIVSSFYGRVSIMEHDDDYLIDEVEGLPDNQFNLGLPIANLSEADKLKISELADLCIREMDDGEMKAATDSAKSAMHTFYEKLSGDQTINGEITQSILVGLRDMLQREFNIDPNDIMSQGQQGDTGMFGLLLNGEEFGEQEVDLINEAIIKFIQEIGGNITDSGRIPIPNDGEAEGRDKAAASIRELQKKFRAAFDGSEGKPNDD